MKRKLLKISFVLLVVFMSLAVGVFTRGAMAWNVTLKWDANTELDLAGYKLYQRVGPDETMVDVGNLITYKVLDLPDGTYTWWLTAYDLAGNESGPSNTVSRTLADPVIDLPPNGPGGVTVIIIMK